MAAQSSKLGRAIAIGLGLYCVASTVFFSFRLEMRATRNMASPTGSQRGRARLLVEVEHSDTDNGQSNYIYENDNYMDDSLVAVTTTAAATVTSTANFGVSNGPPLRFDMMLEGAKTLEIRHQRYIGKRLVGEKGQIWGSVTLGEDTFQIMSDAEWNELRPRHRWPAEKVHLPYAKTWAMTVKEVTLFSSTIRYLMIEGQEGTATYRAVPDGWDPDGRYKKADYERYMIDQGHPAGKGRGAQKRRAAASGTARKRPAAAMDEADAAAAVAPPRQPDLNVPVPPDGRCLSYCALAARDTRAWMRERDVNGFIHDDPDREASEREKAKALVDRIIGAMEDDGLHQKAARLRLAGDAGYPGEDELPFYARVLQGRIELDDPVGYLRKQNYAAADDVVDAEALEIYAESVNGRVVHAAPTVGGGAPIPVIEFGEFGAPLLYRVAFQMKTGPDGHSSPHWILACSYYLPRAARPLPKPRAQFYDLEAGASGGSEDESDGSQGDDVDELGNVFGLIDDGGEDDSDDSSRRRFWEDALRDQEGTATPDAGEAAQGTDTPAAHSEAEEAAGSDELTAEERRKAQEEWADQLISEGMMQPWGEDELFEPEGYDPDDDELLGEDDLPLFDLEDAQDTQLPDAGGEGDKDAAEELLSRAARKRPASKALPEQEEKPKPKKRRWGNNLCPGKQDGARCVYATDQRPGERARVHADRGDARCMFCDGEVLRKRDSVRKGQDITSALKSLMQYDRPDLVDGALDFIAAVLGQEKRDSYKANAERALHRQRKKDNPVPATDLQSEWQEALKHRVSVVPRQKKQTRRAYPTWVRDDRKFRRNKFKTALDDDVEDWAEPQAVAFTKWAELASWGMCKICKRLEKRSFAPADVAAAMMRLPDAERKKGRKAGQRSAWINKCKYCASPPEKRVGYPAVQIEDIPEPLRHLSVAALEALRPMEVSIGPHARAAHGYRVHTDMIGFRWKATDVLTAVSELPERHQRRAMDALEYLEANDDPAEEDFSSWATLTEYYLAHPQKSAYFAIMRLHNRFLRRNRNDLSQKKRRLAMRLVEQLGIETALWPHLYPRVSMCETYVRLMDERRVVRTRAARRAAHFDDADASADSDDAEADGKKRQSLKRSYTAKVFSPVIGYGADTELAQFVYDLWLWTALGGKKHAAKVPMRLALAGMSFSPEYWRTYHFALIDLQRQLGFPTLFVTLSPLEWSTPFHVWVEDEMRRTLRSRTWLPAAETYHLSHVLTQAIVGLLTGTQGKARSEASAAWTQHVLAGKDAEGKPTQRVITQFARIEFQDGKRKRGGPNARHAYHGSGRPHVHCLVWLEKVATIDLPSKVSATIPDDEEQEQLYHIVMGSQTSTHGSHPWPERKEDSIWDVRGKTLRLHHTARDLHHKLRAYMPAVIAGMKSHMDVQTSDGRGMLLRYVSSYTAKFSDQFSSEWLNDEASDYAISRRILTEFHPLEPEMWLQLAAAEYSQVLTHGTVKNFPVPVPWKGKEMPAVVERYTHSAWRPDDMSLLEYVRRSNSRGGVHRALRLRYANLQKANDPSVAHVDLETWAARVPMRGEVLVAARSNSRFSDEYYGQWMLLHVPFRSVHELWQDAAELVPTGYRLFAHCLLHRPDLWRSEAWLRSDMELEAHRDPTIDSNVAMIKAHITLVDDYLEGRLVVGEDPEPPRHHYAFDGRITTLEPEQIPVADLITRRWHRAVELAWPDDYEDHNHGPPDDEDPRPIAVLGPAGSGKSFLIKVVMQDAIAQGARVLLACPTRRQVARYREDMPDLDVDSIHRAFNVYLPEQQTLQRMQDFDLVVIEEISMVEMWIFERLLRLWDAAARRPALVFVGDFRQLRWMDSPRVLEHWRWADVDVRELKIMRRCKCPILKKKLELLRTATPSKPQLVEIRQDHRAPSVGHRDVGWWEREEPTEYEIGQVFEEHPTTTFVTISRAKAAWVNQAALRHFYWEVEPLGTIDADPEFNPRNFYGTKQVSWANMRLPIFEGMRVGFTANIRPEIDFVNGIEGHVIMMDHTGVLVKTTTGHMVKVPPYTNPEWRNVYYPLRLAYATTLMKVQGDTLKHMTLWMDTPGVEAAGYVALSRVQHDKDWKFVGYLQQKHFIP
ncbi:unnamed protein product, partial [Prorocentrum cordatum]